MNDVSPSMKFFLTGVAVVVIGILAVLLVPFIYAAMKYTSADLLAWSIPMKNFGLLALGFGLLAASCFLLAYKRQTITYIVSAVVICISIVCIYSSFLSVVKISQSEIVYQNVWKTYHYSWNDIESIRLTYSTTDEEEIFYVTPKTGETFHFHKNERLANAGIQNIAAEYDISFIEEER